MANPPAPRHNSRAVRALALVAALVLLLLGAVLLWQGSTGFIDEAASSEMSGGDTLVDLLVVAAGAGSLVLALVAARVAEVI
ncbi:hypothetical protein EXE58_11305 [Nocardioides seonyuensis]|uniref:Uncharacterized protein n=1 Tax=Nocardioides seonyuensis TaxID=2518371 RepID=A0A4P7IGV1_9ACTN|nr:hypothetical protein [Nocardioides seonyuensis]QBX55990.1 hypothetical protein EXE58_11305 [Nocardioides seonyuensis]